MPVWRGVRATLLSEREQSVANSVANSIVSLSGEGVRITLEASLKVLIVTGNFRTVAENAWLLDDLATEFARSGHSVDVLVHSPTAPRERGLQLFEDGVRVFSVGAERAPNGRLSKVASYLATGARMHTKGWRWVKKNHYDLCVFPSIAAFSYGFPARLKRRGLVSTLLFVMWDFFPIHQIDIGRIRGGAFAGLLKKLEKLSMQRADVIATMSPANEQFLRSYHDDLTTRTVTIPPWASGTELTAAEKRSRFSVIFGGQLARGRGVDTLIDAAVVLRATGVTVDILIAGSGPDDERLRAYAAEVGATNVSFMGGLPRDQYRELLRSCHAGVAVTVAGVTPPSFPSKIVEYCANGIPVVVSVEDSSDAGSLVETYGAGLAVPAGSSVAIADAIARLATEHTDETLQIRADLAHALFRDKLSVRNAVVRMADEVHVQSR